MAVISQCLQAQEIEGRHQGDVLETVQSSITRIDKSFEDLKVQLAQQILHHAHTLEMLESTKQTIMYGYWYCSRW
jgi:hypothetical protein